MFLRLLVQERNQDKQIAFVLKRVLKTIMEIKKETRDSCNAVLLSNKSP